MRPERIAFYAPMKAPTHPSPSGDRQMARMLLSALAQCGYEAHLASDLKVYLSDPEATETRDALVAAALAERERIDAAWRSDGPPDLWVSYHPYYKSPDLLGPPLCRKHGVPWITVEASLSARRSVGHWAEFQTHALEAVRGAAVNVALTGRDENGLLECEPGARVTRLAPFIDARPYLDLTPRPEPGHLIAVAMMRPGDKLDSYAILARALSSIRDLDWHLTIVGDGPARGRVEALFSDVPSDRLSWVGTLDADGVRDVLVRGALLTWPGSGEAYGLSYLEAQAVGLPVVAQDTAGVPEVVADGVSGLLTTEGDVLAYSAAIRRLLQDSGLRERLARGARDKVVSTHTLERATRRLGDILETHVWQNRTGGEG